MCMKAECEKCHKTTWKGCGKHIADIMKDVPESEQCKCPREGQCGEGKGECHEGHGHEGHGHGHGHGCHGDKGHGDKGHCDKGKHCGQKQ